MISAGFDRAELILREDGYWLAVKPQLEDLPILRRWLYQGVKGRQRLSIAPWKKRRSLDANGYAWALMDKLAQAILEIYRRRAVRIFRGERRYILEE